MTFWRSSSIARTPKTSTLLNGVDGGKRDGTLLRYPSMAQSYYPTSITEASNPLFSWVLCASGKGGDDYRLTDYLWGRRLCMTATTDRSGPFAECVPQTIRKKKTIDFLFVFLNTTLFGTGNTGSSCTSASIKMIGIKRKLTRPCYIRSRNGTNVDQQTDFFSSFSTFLRDVDRVSPATALLHNHKSFPFPFFFFFWKNPDGMIVRSIDWLCDLSLFFC